MRIKHRSMAEATSVTFRIFAAGVEWTGIVGITRRPKLSRRRPPAGI
jgi:hypothetical protein